MYMLVFRSQTTKGIWMARCAGIEPCTLVMDLEGTDGRERGEVFFFFCYTLTFFNNSQGHNSVYCQYPIAICIYIYIYIFLNWGCKYASVFLALVEHMMLIIKICGVHTFLLFSRFTCNISS